MVILDLSVANEPEWLRVKPGKIILSRRSSVYTSVDKCVVDMQALGGQGGRRGCLKSDCNYRNM